MSKGSTHRNREQSRDSAFLPSLDPFAVKAGLVLFDRYCVIGRVTHGRDLWVAPVTDLQRQHGAAPTHNLELFHLPVPRNRSAAIRVALSVESSLQQRVCEVLPVRDGLVVVGEPVHGAPLQGDLEAEDAIRLGVAMTRLLARLHDEGFSGVRFDTTDIRRSSSSFILFGFRHLLSAGTPAEDVRHLKGVLAGLPIPGVDRVLESADYDAHTLWLRIGRLGEESAAFSAAAVLPARAPFVGREGFVGQVYEQLVEARLAKPTVAVVRGEAGQGKTRLMGQLRQDLSSDALVVMGTFRPSGQPGLGLAGALDRLADRLRTLERDEIDDLRTRVQVRTGPMGGVLSRIAPRLGALLGDADAPTRLSLKDRFAQHAVILSDVLRGIGTEKLPLVLLLDNVDVADPGSLAVIRQLVRPGAGHHTLVVLSCRKELPDELTGPQLRYLDLPPFSDEDVARLLERSLPGSIRQGSRVARSLREAGRGVPLAIWTTLLSWVDHGEFHRAENDGPWELEYRNDTHPPVVDMFRYRIDQISPDSRELGLLCALFPGSPDPAWLSQVSGLESERVARGLDTLSALGLLLRDDPSGGLRFPHGSVRELFISNAGTERRVAGHRRLAEWLRAQPEPSPVQQAWHEEQAAPPGRDDDLAELDLRAGNELLSIYDLDRARWFFECALRRSAGLANRVSALEGLADTAFLQDRIEESTTHYSEALAEAEDQVRMVNLAAKAVYAMDRKGQATGAIRIGRITLERLGVPLGESSAARLLTLAQAGAGINAAPRGADDVLRDALVLLYLRLTPIMLPSDQLSAFACMMRGKKLADKLDTANAAAINAMFAAGLAVRGKVGAAAQLIDDALAMAERNDDRHAGALVHHFRALNAYAVGDYAGGKSAADTAVEAFRRAGDMSIGALTLFTKAQYGCERESVDTVFRWLDEAQLAARRQGNEFIRAALGSLDVLLRARTGAADPLPAAEKLSKRLDESDCLVADFALANAYLAMALCHVGRVELARERLNRIEHYINPRMPMPDGLRDIQIAIATVLLEVPEPTKEEIRRRDHAIAQLQKNGRRSPRLHAAWLLFRARLAVKNGHLGKARTLLTRLIATATEHRQFYTVMNAHLLCADLTAAEDVGSAREHLALAAEQAQALQVSLPPRMAATVAELDEDDVVEPAPPMSVPDIALDEPELVISEILNDLVEPLRSALPQGSNFHLQVPAQHRVLGDRQSLELLAVNLVLTARDATPDLVRMRLLTKPMHIDPDEAAAMNEGRAGRFMMLQVRSYGSGPTVPLLGGLGACRQAVARLSGFLDVRNDSERELVISAFLRIAESGAEPEEESPTLYRGRALVTYPDPRVRRTVVSALVQVGFDCEELETEDLNRMRIPSDIFVFVDPATEGEFHKNLSDATSIVLLRRGDKTSTSRPVLRYPFAISKLEELVDTILK